MIIHPYRAAKQNRGIQDINTSEGRQRLFYREQVWEFGCWFEMMDYLAEERKKAEFDVEAMKIAWAGSEHAFRTNDRISRLVANDPVRWSNAQSFFFPPLSFFLY